MRRCIFIAISHVACSNSICGLRLKKKAFHVTGRGGLTTVFQYRMIGE
jgi:hypothetical protein